MLRLEVRNAAVPIEKKPSWIKTTAKMGPEYRELQQMVKAEDLHTVCQSAGCPNIFECWEDREATFLIGGDQCTRRCDFCQIDTGKPEDLDRDEPRRVAESVRPMQLRYATRTGAAPADPEEPGAPPHGAAACRAAPRRRQRAPHAAAVRARRGRGSRRPRGRRGLALRRDRPPDPR